MRYEIINVSDIDLEMFGMIHNIDQNKLIVTKKQDESVCFRCVDKNQKIIFVTAEKDILNGAKYGYFLIKPSGEHWKLVSYHKDKFKLIILKAKLENETTKI